MKTLVRRTAAAALAGVMTVGMLSGCGEKKLDGTKTVATVNGTELPMGVLSLYARQMQAQYEAMYLSFMGSAEIWDQETEDGKTYGQQTVEDCLTQLETMYLLKENAGDYGVEITEDDQKKIEEAAAAFMEANTEEAIAELAVTEDQVKTLLELQTYQERVHQAIIEEAAVEISDEEAQQSGFTYVSVSLSGEELTEDDIAEKKENAQKILDQMKEDPAADMTEIAKGVDDSLSALEGTFTTNLGEDEEEEALYPAEVMEVLRGLQEGEVAPELIETENSVYIVRLDTMLDEDATESKKDSLKTEKEDEYYTEKTEEWLEAADVKTEDKVLKGLTITNSHSFSMKMEEIEDEAAEEDVTEEDMAEDVADEELDAETEEADVVEEDTADAEEVDADAAEAEEDTAEEEADLAEEDTAEEADTDAADAEEPEAEDETAE